MFTYLLSRGSYYHEKTNPVPPIEGLRKDRLRLSRGAFGARQDIIFLEVDDGSIRLRHNVSDIAPFWMILAPFERSRCQLSNGTKLVKNGLHVLFCPRKMN